MAPLALVDDPRLMAGLLFVSGLTIAPTLIASVAVVEAAVPRTRLTEALGWTSMGVAAGVAAGAAALGRLIDLDGARSGFWGATGFGVLLVLASLTVRQTSRAAGPDPADPGQG